jgi:hypothetical protein
MTWPTLDAEKSVITSIKTMVNGDILFRISDSIQLLNLFSEAITANDATASTLQYSVTPDVGAVATISGVSAALTSAIAGTVLVLDGGALAAAPALSASGVALAQTARGIIIPAGTIKLVIGVGSTTGTWMHHIRYIPLHPGAYVTGV